MLFYTFRKSGRFDIEKDNDVMLDVGAGYDLITSGVLGKEYRRVSPRGKRPSAFDDEEGPDLTPPGEGFELYRYKNAEKMSTKNWHGYYWASRTKQGDYEIRSVSSTLGEHSVPGGVFPKEGFEQYYEKMDL